MGGRSGGWTRSAGEDAQGAHAGADSIGARPTPAQARGAAAEALAAEHLAAHGLRVIARNVRCRGGEVDLVCLDRSHVVFVEVRLRSNGRFGGAAESITAAKQRRLVRAATRYLAMHPRLALLPSRFDVVCADGKAGAVRIEWLRDAFQAQP